MFSQKTYWQKIASSSEELENKIPPNRYYKISIRGRQIIIGKGSKGFFALRDKCPHQNKPLSEGYSIDDRVICIYHQFSFDVYTGLGSCGGVDNYSIEKREDGVFLGIQYLSLFDF